MAKNNLWQQILYHLHGVFHLFSCKRILTYGATFLLYEIKNDHKASRFLWWWHHWFTLWATSVREGGLSFVRFLHVNAKNHKKIVICQKPQKKN